MADDDVTGNVASYVSPPICRPRMAVATSPSVTTVAESFAACDVVAPSSRIAAITAAVRERSIFVVVFLLRRRCGDTATC